DRPVHRSPRGRQETVLLQGRAVSADRSGLADGVRVPPPRLALLNAVAAAGLNRAARATRPAAGHPAPNPRSAPWPVAEWAIPRQRSCVLPGDYALRVWRSPASRWECSCESAPVAGGATGPARPSVPPRLDGSDRH